MRVRGLSLRAIGEIAEHWGDIETAVQRKSGVSFILSEVCSWLPPFPPKKSIAEILEAAADLTAVREESEGDPNPHGESKKQDFSGWARVISDLIAAGHADPLSYTPRQAAAHLRILTEREKDNRAADFSITRAAMWADGKAAKNFMRELQK